MRDTKVLEQFRERVQKRLKEMNIFVNLKKSVEHGANGTQEYVIKKGVNKGKVAKQMWEIGCSISIAICILGVIAILLWSWNNEDK